MKFIFYFVLIVLVGPQIDIQCGKLEPEKKIAADATTQSSMDALTQAIKSDNPEKVEMELKKSAALINGKNHSDVCPLKEALRMGNKKIIETLINMGADVNHSTALGHTFLDEAVETNALDKAALLIKAKADINRQDREGATPLYRAIEREYTDMAQLLINSGADINQATKKKWTPLHLAVDKGDKELVKLLIKAKADVNAATDKGIKPLDLALEGGYKEIIDMLKKSGATKSNYFKRIWR